MNRIAFLDLETTGTDIKKDQIVQIAIVVKSWPDLELIIEQKLFVKPTIPIPREAIDVHGITPEKVANALYFKNIAYQIVVYLAPETEFFNIVTNKDIKW